MSLLTKKRLSWRLSRLAAYGWLAAAAACGVGESGEPGARQGAGLPSGAQHIRTRPIPSQSTACTDGTLLTYENFGEAFMSQHCVSCHSSQVTGSQRFGAPEGVDFDDRADVQRRLLSIQKIVAAPGRHLGRDFSMSARSKAHVLKWLECGAP